MTARPHEFGTGGEHPLARRQGGPVDDGILSLRHCGTCEHPGQGILVPVGNREAEVRRPAKGEVQRKNIAVLVTRESHVLEQILCDNKARCYQGTVRVIVSNSRALMKRYRRPPIPFHHVPTDCRARSEAMLLGVLKRHKIDLIILARYMQILSPQFVSLYRGRIINIHPSLLPAFPGARAYLQAYHAGVRVAGVTAHFVTRDLDRGPIIDQEAFTIDKTSATLKDIVARGRSLEAQVLSRAIQLYCADRLCLRRGRVLWRT